MLLSLLPFLFLFVSRLPLDAALHVPQKNAIALFLKRLLLLVNTFLMTVFTEAFVLVFWCVVFLAISSLFASFFLLFFAVLVFLASGCTVFLFERDSFRQQLVHFFTAWIYAFWRNHCVWSVFLKTYSWIVLWNQLDLFLSAVFLLLFKHVCATRSHRSFLSWVSWRFLKFKWWLLVFNVFK